MKKYVIVVVTVVIAGCGSEGPWPGGLTAEESPYAAIPRVQPAIGVTFEDLVGDYLISPCGGPDTHLALEKDCQFMFVIFDVSHPTYSGEGTWLVEKGRIILTPDAEDGSYTGPTRLDTLYYINDLVLVDADNNSGFPNNIADYYFRAP